MTNETKEVPELKKPEKKVSSWTTEEAGNIKYRWNSRLSSRQY